MSSFTRIRIKDELNNEFKYSKVWRLTHVFTFLGTPRQHSPVCITIIGHDMLSSDLHSKGIVSVFSFIAFRFVYMPLADCIIYDSHHMYFCIKENKRFLVISLLNLLGLIFFICMFVLVSYRTKSPRYSWLVKKKVFFDLKCNYSALFVFQSHTLFTLFMIKGKA